MQELANSTGLSRETISNIIHGRSKRIDYIEMIAKALGISLIDDSENILIDPTIYYTATKMIAQALPTNIKRYPKKHIEKLIYRVYTFLLKKNITEDVAKSYAQQIIEDFIDK